jgi:hypothetical protein
MLPNGLEQNPVLKKAFDICGVTFPLRVGLNQHESDMEIYYKLNKTFKMKAFGRADIYYEFVNPTFLYSKKTQTTSIEATTSLVLLEREFTGRGELKITTDKQISGWFMSINDSEYDIPYFDVYLSKVKVVFTTADDQALKIGLGCDFTLKHRDITAPNEIGYLEVKPGIQIYNSDITAKFPLSLPLSLSSLLSLVLRRTVKLPLLLDSIVYSGYTENRIDHPLTFVYEPSNECIAYTGRASFFNYPMYKAELVINKQGIDAKVEGPVISVHEILRICHSSDKKRGPILQISCRNSGVDSLDKNISVLKDQYSQFKFEFDGQIIIFGSSLSLKGAKLSDDELTMECSLQLNIAGIKTTGKTFVNANLRLRHFILLAKAQYQTNLTIRNEIYEELSLGTVTIGVDIEVNSKSKLIHIDGLFNAQRFHAGFRFHLSIDELDDLPVLILQFAEEALEKDFGGTLKNMREMLAYLDPSRIPAVRSAIDKVDNAIDKVRHGFSFPRFSIRRPRLHRHLLESHDKETKQAAEMEISLLDFPTAVTAQVVTPPTDVELLKLLKIVVAIAQEQFHHAYESRKFLSTLFVTDNEQGQFRATQLKQAIEDCVDITDAVQLLIEYCDSCKHFEEQSFINYLLSSFQKQPTVANFLQLKQPWPANAKERGAICLQIKDKLQEFLHTHTHQAKRVRITVGNQ